MSKYAYNLNHDEIWSYNDGELYETREDCIDIANKEAKKLGLDVFYIGIANPYKRPAIDVEDVLENLEMNASEELPWEIASEMYKTDARELKDLQNRFEKVFDEWLKENNINPSDSYVIKDIEEINCY